MKTFAGLGMGILGLALLIGLVFGANWLDIEVMRIFGTQRESAITDIYRNNKSYVEGTVRDLRELQVEYLKADEGHKDALKSLILQRANELDWDRLPADVRGFLKEIN